MRRLCAVLLVVVVVVMSMVPVSQAGTITLMFHYHKTGHDLILSIAKSLVARRMAVVPDGWKFSFLQGRHGWQHPNVSAPKEPAHWAAAHRTPGVNRSEITMQCLRWGQLERHLREPSRQLALMSPRPVLVYTSSPDFACPDAASHWGAPAKALPRVIHFVRDPWTMAVSSFLYHNQERTPERFVGRFMRPCAKNDLGHQFLAEALKIPVEVLDVMYEHHVQLFRRLQHTWFEAHPGALEAAMEAISTSSHQLLGPADELNEGHATEERTPGSFYDLLRAGPSADTVRLEATRMLSHQGSYLCGNGATDIVRMMANFPAIKKNFPKSQSFLMSEWTSKDPGVKDAAFIRLLRVLCGDQNDCGLTGGYAQLKKIALQLRQEEDAEMAKPSMHHTGGAGTGVEGQTQESRQFLEQRLRDDPIIWPMLEYGHCLVVLGGEPGVGCIFNTSAMAAARVAVGWLSTDGPRPQPSLNNPQPQQRPQQPGGLVVPPHQQQAAQLAQAWDALGNPQQQPVQRQLWPFVRQQVAHPPPVKVTWDTWAWNR